MIQKIAKATIHTISGNRKAYYKGLEEIAANSEGKVVLEIGSGKQIKGKNSYSAVHLFPDAEEFIMTDINPDFGHKVLDITKMKDKEKYDIILCLNVLEHVFEFQKAVDNMHKSLKMGGTLCIAVPFAFPLHDEPTDYWRYTEHSLRKILSDFKNLTIKHQRSRRFPTGYFVTAIK